jgi:transcriptional regulator with XRE-family HTH domain
MENATTLAKRVYAAMRHAGITEQKDLAKAIGVSKQAVQKWLSGKSDYIRPEHLFKIADVTKINARWIALGEGAPVRPTYLTPEESELVEIYRALALSRDPDAVQRRDMWIRLGRLEMKALAPASPANPHGKKIST